MTNKELFDHNIAMLGKIDLTIRKKVLSVIEKMVSDGLRPIIHKDVWRSPADQLDKFNRGVSKLKFGFHCFVNSDGSPASLAADIVDADQGWFADEKWRRQDGDERFWSSLGRHAIDNGLNWGGLWFYENQKARAEKLIKEVAHGEFYNGQDFGWDVAHIETPFMTVNDAYTTYKSFGF